MTIKKISIQPTTDTSLIQQRVEQLEPTYTELVSVVYPQQHVDDRGEPYGMLLDQILEVRSEDEIVLRSPRNNKRETTHKRGEINDLSRKVSMRDYTTGLKFDLQWEPTLPPQARK